MKLHLPKGLRTALLAVFALASVSYPAQAAAPAAYDYMVKVTPTKLYYENSNAENPKTSYIIDGFDMSTNWVMSVVGSKINGAPCDDQPQYTGGATIIGNADVPYKASQIKGGDVAKPKMEDHQFAIYFTPNGKIYSLSNKGKQLLGQDPNGKTSLNAGITPFKVTLNWVVNEDGTGSLYYTGGSSVYIQGDTVGNLTDSHNFKTERITILDHVVLTDAVKDSLRMLWTTSTANADLRQTTEIITELYSKGGGSDPAAWQITGKADLYTLMNGGEGGYTDNTETGNGAVSKVISTDTVYFIGNSGIIYTETDDSYNNKTLTQADLLKGEATSSIGFGAAANKTLTVGNAALSETILNGSAGLRIVGEGTVELELNANDSISQLEIGSGSTLVLNADGNVTLDAGTSKITGGSLVHKGATGTFLIRSYSSDTLVLDNLANEADGTLQIATVSTVVANTIKSNGALSVTGNTQAIESIEAKSLYLGGQANMSTKDITIHGDAQIGDGWTKAGKNVLTTSGTVFVEGNLNVYGQLNATASDVVSAASVATINEGVIAAKKIMATSASSAGATVSHASGELLSGNVIIGPSGIQADKLADSAEIKFAADSTGKVTTKAMSGSTIHVGNDTVVSYASTDKLIAVGRSSLTATGKLTSGEINLTENYKLAAAELAASSIKAGDTEIAARIEGYSYASHQNISVTTDANKNCIITADSIDAKSVTIGKDDQLIGATVTTADGLSLGENAAMTNVTVNAGTETTAGKNATLKNVTIASGKFINSDTVNLDNVTFTTNGTGAETTYGGSQGTAFGVTNNVESVQITGTQNGDTTKIDKLVLNAEGLDFANIADGGTEYSFISGENLEYTYDAQRDQMNIKSFVRARMEQIDNGDGTFSIKISGQEDTEGIKGELSNTHNRTAAMEAMASVVEPATSTAAYAMGRSTATASSTSSPLADIYEYVGHVNRYSADERCNVLSAASGASLAVLADSQRRGLRDVQDNLRNRIVQMGGGTNAGLTTDWDYVGLQAWAQADGGRATTDGSSDEWGYDYDTTGATVGANIDLTANTVLGMSFSVSTGEISVDSTDYAKGNNDAKYVSLFARHQKERWVQMFIFTYGMNEMDMERNVLGYHGQGDTKGSSFSAYYEIGYTLGLNYDYTHIVQPLASISFTSASVESYEEEGSIGDAAMNYGNNKYTYGQLAVGARYQGILYETVHERNAVVEARALITHDFGDTTNEATVSYALSNEFKVKCADSSGFGYKIGAGISIPVEQHTTLYADVDYTTAPDYTGFRADIGVRYDF